DRAARVQVGREPGRRLGVEVVHGALVAARVVGGPGGHRVDQALLDVVGAQVPGRDRAGDGPAVPGTVVGDDVGLGDDLDGPHGHQGRVAGPQPDPVQLAAHSSSLAIALSAAAAMALPPRRPRTTRCSRPDGWADRASLDSAAPTKPTGTPMTAAGLGAPSSLISRARSGPVGVLPTATTEPSSRSRHSSRAAALRVVLSRAASSGTAGSDRVHSTSLPAGSRLRVTPLATICTSHRTGAPARSACRARATTWGLKERSRTRSTMPQAWIIRTATRLTSAGRAARSASARMVAKDSR